MGYRIGQHTNRRERFLRNWKTLHWSRSSAVAAGMVVILVIGLVGHTSGMISLMNSNNRDDQIILSSAKRKNGKTATSSASTTTSNAKNAKNATKEADLAAAEEPVLRSVSCDNGTPMRAGLDKSSVPQLRKLAQHEAVCGSAVMDRVSFFVGTPTTVQQAKDEAGWVADTLKEYAKYGLGPLVFMEPSYDGNALDSKQYRAGAYDEALKAYFAAIKAKGVTDAMMGMWVPFPEANIPVWSSTDPGDYAANVTKTAQIQKQYFPGSKVSVMLDSKSYPSAASWEGGSYKSLLPYVSGVSKGLIDAFGLQGFAWPPQDDEPAQLDAKVFLPNTMAVEAAAAMGVQDVWFNTGSYGRAARQNKSKPNTLSQGQRQVVMDGIITQAKAVQSKGYKATIHLFAEDKFATGEAIDWSYWDVGQSDADSFKAVYRTFVSDARKAGIGLWLFDGS